MIEVGHVGSDLVRVAQSLEARGDFSKRPLHVLASTGSTNDDAKTAARAGAPHGSVWIAEEQSSGRGRQGRSWTSPPGESLLFSVLLRVACPPSRVPPLSLVCGLVVRDAVATAIGDDRRVLVKWPNDVVVLGQEAKECAPFRKIAGILVESSLVGSTVEHVIVGIGLNVHTRLFPPELEPIATSIARESSTPASRAEILADLLTSLDRDVEQVAQRGLAAVHARLARYDALSGRAVASDDGSVDGIASGIDLDGRLLVRQNDGSFAKVASGEVHLRIA